MFDGEVSEERQKMYTAFVNFEKAYDWADRQAIWDSAQIARSGRRVVEDNAKFIRGCKGDCVYCMGAK